MICYDAPGQIVAATEMSPPVARLDTAPQAASPRLQGSDKP
ncbi:MAG TPA: hypothetical protein VG328_13820 [Stellaceae bacterium]|jgi:hypothetical protein|nr:hypothetical protein [Stellaceae bacterium]